MIILWPGIILFVLDAFLVPLHDAKIILLKHFLALDTVATVQK